MPTLFTKYNEKNWFPEHNALREYLSFELSLEEQMKAIEQKAKELGETDSFEISLHKHFLAVTAMLEAQSMISNDDHRQYLDEPAEWLNRTTREVYALSHSGLNGLKNSVKYTQNMVYSSVTFQQLRSNYQVLQDFKDLEFQKVDKIQASQRLRDDISEGKQMELYSEKAKSEFLIAPIFREIQRENKEITLISGASFNIQGHELLTGSPDFMISAKPRRADIEAPIFCLVKTKNGVVEDGYAQCAAEMYAAKLFNQESNEPYQVIYGAVTNAYEWVFLKLEGNIVYIDTERYFLNDLSQILGIFQYVINQIKK
jgi:hypothetical protein